MNAGDNPDRLVAIVSPDFDAYATGRTARPECVIYEEVDCVCDELFPFGSDAYMNRLNEIHGRTNR